MQNQHREVFYSKYHSNYKTFISSVDEKALNSLFTHYDYKILPVIKNYNISAKILELGCGPGYLLKYLQSKGFDNTFGIDISEEQIQIAKNEGLNVIQADVFDFLKTTNEKYDLIFAFDFIEHFTKDELVELAKLIYEKLNDNGAFIIRTPNGEGFFAGYAIYGDLTHQTIFTTNSLIQLLSQAGFNQIECFENGPIVKDLKGFLRKITWEFFKVIINIFRLSEIGGKIKILTQDFYGVAYKKIEQK